MIAFDNKKVAFISSYLPRKCGIATFTADLIRNVKLAGGAEFEPQVFAVQAGRGLEYDERVRFKIRSDVEHDYIAASDYINSSNIDVVSVQHEFGLFGGLGGSYITLLLKKGSKSQ